MGPRLRGDDERVLLSKSLTLVNDVTVSCDLSFNPWVMYFDPGAHVLCRALTDLNHSGTDQRTLHDQRRGCRRGPNQRQPACGRTPQTAVAGGACGNHPEGPLRL